MADVPEREDGLAGVVVRGPAERASIGFVLEGRVVEKIHRLGRDGRGRVGNARERGLEETRVMPRGGGDRAVLQPFVRRVFIEFQRGENRLARAGVRRQIGEREKRGEAHLRIGISEQRRDEARRKIFAQRHQRGAAHARGGVLERLARGDVAKFVTGLKFAEALQSPDRVERAGVEAEFIHGGVADEFHERIRRARELALDEQALCVHAPEEVLVLERGDEFVVGGFGEVERFREFAVLVRDAVNAAVGFVAQRDFVGVALARFEARGRGVVLHDVVVPIDHPQRAVGADLGHDGRGPFVVTREKRAAVLRNEIRAVRFEHEFADKMPGGFGHERDAVPIRFRKTPRRVERVARGRGVTAVDIDLAHFFRDGKKA